MVKQALAAGDVVAVSSEVGPVLAVVDAILLGDALAHVVSTGQPLCVPAALGAPGPVLGVAPHGKAALARCLDAEMAPLSAADRAARYASLPSLVWERAIAFALGAAPVVAALLPNAAPVRAMAA